MIVALAVADEKMIHTPTSLLPIGTLAISIPWGHWKHCALIVRSTTSGKRLVIHDGMDIAKDW